MAVIIKKNYKKISKLYKLVFQAHLLYIYQYDIFFILKVDKKLYSIICFKLRIYGHDDLIELILYFFNYFYFIIIKTLGYLLN